MDNANASPHSDHDWAQQMLPWAANGTLAEADAARLHEHLRHCAICRADLETERRIARHVAQDVVVPYSAEAGLARLLRRIDEHAAQPGPVPALIGERQRARRTPRRRPWYAVAVTAQAAAILALSLVTIRLAMDPSPQDDYRTLANTPPAALGNHLQVVFSASLTPAEAGRLLDRIGGHLIAGPSPAGVVLVALSADAKSEDYDSAAERLAQSPGVSFVAVQRAPAAP